MNEPLHSWGRYPGHPQTAHSCYWRSDLPKQLAELSPSGTLPFGNGRSYGDSCLAASDHVLRTRPLDRFIEADWNAGTIRVEAGATLAEITAVALPHGWFLPVSPGTEFATVGGAIANDVHGKNHHVRGTFGRHVRRFSLLRSDGARVCSPAENQDYFAATIGGLGLAGVIEWAEIALMPVKSAHIDSMSVRFGNLADFFALSNELDHSHEYSVAWVDCLASGAKAGRGVFTVGDHATDGDFSIKPRARLAVPVTPRFSLVNKLTLRGFNEAYWRRGPAERTRKTVDLASFLYPLDRIHDWNRIYGRKGFQQYQCVVPAAVAESATRELLAAIAHSGEGSFLAVLKRCGDLASPGLLSFPIAGTSLALDFPQNARLETTLFPRLDAVVREAGGRLYPAKDAHLRGEDFRRAYPAWEKVESLRDPALNSRFWQRVTR